MADRDDFEELIEHSKSPIRITRIRVVIKIGDDEEIYTEKISKTQYGENGEIIEDNSTIPVIALCCGKPIYNLKEISRMCIYRHIICDECIYNRCKLCEGILCEKHTNYHKGLPVCFECLEEIELNSLL